MTCSLCYWKKQECRTVQHSPTFNIKSFVCWKFYFVAEKYARDVVLRLQLVPRQHNNINNLKRWQWRRIATGGRPSSQSFWAVFGQICTASHSPTQSNMIMHGVWVLKHFFTFAFVAGLSNFVCVAGPRMHVHTAQCVFRSWLNHWCQTTVSNVQQEFHGKQSRIQHSDQEDRALWRVDSQQRSNRQTELVEMLSQLSDW